MIPFHEFEQINDANIRIVKLGHLTKYDVTKPHRHDYFELFVFDKGAGVHDVDFVEFPIGSQEIHIVSAGRVHKVKRKLDTSGYVILFDPTIFSSNSLLSAFLLDHLCYDVEEFPIIYQFEAVIKTEIISVVNNIWEDYNSDKKLKTEFMVNNLALILINCIRTLKEINSPIEKNREIYSDFRKLLHERFRDLRKVRDYAQALNLSEKQLNKIVKEKSGLPASHLIYKQIILEAKRLLNAGLSVKEVAFTLNFEDPAHFSKFFKGKTKISPSEFRKVQP